MQTRWTVIFLLLIISCSTAKKTRTAPAENEPVLENALLWSVTGKDLKSPSYLYGTIHMICKEDFLFSSTLKEKLQDAKSIYLEIDMDDPSMMMKMASMSIMKGHTLKDLMSGPDYTMVSAYVKDSLQMPIMLFNHLKPVTLMSMLYTKVLPCSSSESYEQKFMDIAKSQHKEVRGLEKVEDQMAVFDKIPDTSQARMIVEMIRGMPEQRKEFAEMVEAYKNEELGKLADQMGDSPEWKGYEDILLVNRNQRWIPVMEKAMHEGSQFFAVGAGHLPGKEGIVTLLRKAGYTVTPVKQALGEIAHSKFCTPYSPFAEAEAAASPER